MKLQPPSKRLICLWETSYNGSTKSGKYLKPRRSWSVKEVRVILTNFIRDSGVGATGPFYATKKRVISTRFDDTQDPKLRKLLEAQRSAKLHAPTAWQRK